MAPLAHSAFGVFFSTAAWVSLGPTEFPAVIILNDLPPEAGCGVDGPEEHARLGVSLDGGGDYNADGVADFLVGAPGPLLPGPPTSNHAYVFFGRPGLHLPDDLLLQGFDGINGFDIPGEHHLAGMGHSVAHAGDLNGDGIGDLIASSVFCEYPRGRAYVIFGRAGLGAPGTVDVRTLDGTNGFVIGGIEGWLGSSVAGLGDINGDGYDDVAVGAKAAHAPGRQVAGRVGVVFGGPAVGAGGFVDLLTLTGTNGFVVNGAVGGDQLGSYVAGAGDINHDGFEDLLISAPYAHPIDPSTYGQVCVIFGGPSVGAGGIIELGLLNGTDGFLIDAVDTDLRVVSGVGDVNCDGIDDFGLGGNGDECYVVFGNSNLGAGGAFDLTTVNGQNGLRVPVHSSIYAAVVPGSRCDLNHDGYDDLVVGFPIPISEISGSVYVFFGRPGLGSSGMLSPDDLNGANGFAVHSVDRWFATGGALAGVGDVNVDGVDDLLIGSPNAGVGPDDRPNDAGRFDVLFGQAKFGDFDRDKDIDMADFMDFVMCYNGPLRPPAGGCPEGVNADFDSDGDVDLADYATFSQNYTGAR